MTGSSMRSKAPCGQAWPLASARRIRTAPRTAYMEAILEPETGISFPHPQEERNNEDLLPPRFHHEPPADAVRQRSGHQDRFPGGRSLHRRALQAAVRGDQPEPSGADAG